VPRLRSLLFAPGNDERKLRRALQEPADAVVADLEDGVPTAEKEHARDVVRAVLAEGERGPRRFVRVNGHETEIHEADLEALAGLDLDGIVLSKAKRGVRVPPGLPVIATVETAVGVATSRDVACTPGVVALLLGTIDLALDLSLVPRADGAELAYFRSTVVLESTLAGLARPIDGVHVDVRDLDGLRGQALLARTFGMGGKACVHPAQVAVVNECFAPSAEEIEHAQRVVAAYRAAAGSGSGVVVLDGRMVDLPVFESARRLLGEEGLWSEEGEEGDGRVG
jgi:citrate lyase subunit beta / citryl-CoA lyase